MEKKKPNNIMVKTKKDCRNKHEINIENYLIKKNIENEEYGRHRYRNMPEGDKEKLREYRKKILYSNENNVVKNSFFYKI